MPLTLGKHQVPSSSVAAGDWSSDPSAGTGKSIVMLVTNEGLADPRVLRSMQTAHRAGFEIRLVCRVPAKEKEEIVPPGVRVHRLPPLWGRRLLKRLLSRPQDAPDVARVPGRPAPIETVAPHGQKDGRASFWLKPWGVWIIRGITWFNLQRVALVSRVRAALWR